MMTFARFSTTSCCNQPLPQLLPLPNICMVMHCFCPKAASGSALISDRLAGDMHASLAIGWRRKPVSQNSQLSSSSKFAPSPICKASLREMANQKIDVHAHFLSPTYRKALLEHGYLHSDGMPGIPGWSTGSHLAYMDSHGIAKSILSVSFPGTVITFDSALNQTLTRESYAYAANIKSTNPDRFGYFASLPLPDVPASLAEIKHVFDGPLKADGIAMLSNSSGLYLGDPRLRPVLDELNARKAVVFVHPTSPCRQVGLKCQDVSEMYAESAPLATT